MAKSKFTEVELEQIRSIQEKSGCSRKTAIRKFKQSQAAAKAGFRAVELFENDLTFFNGKPRDARLLAADLGLEIVALQPLRDFEAMPDPMRARNFERAARMQLAMQAAAAAGATLTVPPHDVCEKAARQFRELEGDILVAGEREWPAFLRQLDRSDPSYRQ